VPTFSPHASLDSPRSPLVHPKPLANSVQLSSESFGNTGSSLMKLAQMQGGIGVGDGVGVAVAVALEPPPSSSLPQPAPAPTSAVKTIATIPLEYRIFIGRASSPILAMNWSIRSFSCSLENPSIF
jgi:hypothetical protein